LYAYPDVVTRAGTDLIRHPGVDTMVRAVKAVVGQPLLLAVMVLLLAASLRGSWRSRRRVLVLACLVPLGVDAVVAAWRSPDLARYALFASPPLLLLAADGLVRLPRADRVAALVVVGWSMAVGLADYSAVGSRDSDYRPVARLLAARSARGEVLVTPPAARDPLAYYLRRDSAVSLRAVGTGGALAAWLRAAPRSPTWVVIDYRSPLHELTPRALQAELGARLVDDRFAGDLDAAPRVLLAAPRLGDARPVTAGGP
jgi:hypothetical protein